MFRFRNFNSFNRITNVNNSRNFNRITGVNLNHCIKFNPVRYLYTKKYHSVGIDFKSNPNKNTQDYIDVDFKFIDKINKYDKDIICIKNKVLKNDHYINIAYSINGFITYCLIMLLLVDMCYISFNIIFNVINWINYINSLE